MLDDLVQRFDDSATGQQRVIDTQDAREAAWRRQQWAQARAAYARLLAIMQGQQPTREPIQTAPAAGMLPLR